MKPLPIIGLGTLVKHIAPGDSKISAQDRAVVLADVIATIEFQLQWTHWPIAAAATVLCPIAALCVSLGVPLTSLYKLGPVGACGRLVATLVFLTWFDHDVVLASLATSRQ